MCEDHSIPSLRENQLKDGNGSAATKTVETAPAGENGTGFQVVQRKFVCFRMK